jgi:hypothetical protein
VTLLVVTHVAATLFMTGMIWTVQVLHYPLFAVVGVDRFVAYEAAHATRITAIIAVPWAVEVVTTAALLVSTPSGVSRWLVVTGAAMAAIPVLVTVLLSVPAHAILNRGFDELAHRRLVRTNWLRTLGWTAHAAVALWIAVLALRASPAG